MVEGRGLDRTMVRTRSTGSLDGAIPLSLASYKGTAAIGVKCLEMSANTVCALPSAGAVVIGGKAPGWRAGPSVMLSDAAPAIDQQP